MDLTIAPTTKLTQPPTDSIGDCQSAIDQTQINPNHINGQFISPTHSNDAQQIITEQLLSTRQSPDLCCDLPGNKCDPIDDGNLIIGDLDDKNNHTDPKLTNGISHDDTCHKLISERCTRISSSSMYDFRDHNPIEYSASTTSTSAASTSTVFEHIHHSDRAQSGGLGPYPRGSVSSRHSHKQSRIVIRKFQKLDSTLLSSTPAPDVKIGQRIAYKEYYGNEFGTIRWIGRVPQICPDWTVGVEFDNAIGEGDGSLNGRRYFIAKDCFAKFLPLAEVALVDQHVGRPEPGTMISVMSAAVRPGQMISIQRVSTVHVQHCFLNAPHRKPGADILAVNTRLHCQCPNCGPCAHVIKPPRTERLVKSGKNATHMCQFSTYTCCGMESQEEALCTYTGNKVSSLPPPKFSSSTNLPPVGNSWMEGSGYLSQLQFQQRKLMPEEYKYGAAPEDASNPEIRRQFSRRSSRTSGRRRNQHGNHRNVKSAMGVEEQKLALARSVTPDAQAKACSCCPTPEVEKIISPRLISPLTTPNVDVATVKSSEVYTDEENYVEAEKAPAKIVHRDSIENRYLFPTDDPIDSAFEADLEDLSQARYGHCGGRNDHNGNVSTSGGSRNLLKSLKSLVSCLSSSAQSQAASEFGDHFSERTFKFSGNGQPAGSKMMKSMNGDREQYNYKRDSQSDDEGAYHYDEDYNLDEDYEYSDSNCKLDKLSDMQNNSLSLAPISNNCSDSIKSTNGTASNQRTIKQINLSHQYQQTRTRVSGSSDCGFSSASQNSMNFSSSPLASFEEDKRMSLVYRQIVTRLLNSPSITNDDIQRLKRALVLGEQQQQQQQSANCCLHRGGSCTGSNVNLNSPSDNQHSDQIITELIRKAHLSQQQQQQQQANNPIDAGQTQESDPHPVRTDIRQQQQSANSSSCLPKAFELKLTLSINNNDSKSSTNTDQPAEGANSPKVILKDITARGTSDDTADIDPTYNISIVNESSGESIHHQSVSQNEKPMQST